MVYEEYQAEIEELTRRAIFLATADERHWDRSIKPAVMRERVEDAIFHGETDVARLAAIALGDEVVVQFPFCGKLSDKMGPPPPPSQLERFNTKLGRNLFHRSGIGHTRDVEVERWKHHIEEP